MAVTQTRPLPRTQEAAERSTRQRVAVERRRRGFAVTQSLGSALDGMLANKLRSALTMLGIMIGVGAVIVMIALGQGARADVQKRLSALGTNLLVVTPGSGREGAVRIGAGSLPTLTEADAQAIQQQITGLTGVSPQLGGNDQVVYQGQNWATRWQGVYPAYLQMLNYQVQSGSPITDQDESSRATVALLGQTVVNNLFNGESPLGQTIRIRNVPFTVEGVLAPKGSNGFQDQDDVILIPFSTAKARLSRQTWVGSISIQVADPSQMSTVEDEITQLLRDRHKLRTPTNDFNIRNNNDIQQTASATTNTLTLLLAGVAAVSLVVGGIGIMNIMLVSVVERTREIGIRMAIGARRAVIMSQFLVEAVTLSVIGGAIGVLLGIGAATLMSHLVGWSTVVTLFSIVLAFGFSAAVGIIFGFYPARSASRLDPIVALRAE